MRDRCKKEFTGKRRSNRGVMHHTNTSALIGTVIDLSIRGALVHNVCFKINTSSRSSNSSCELVAQNVFFLVWEQKKDPKKPAVGK